MTISAQELLARLETEIRAAAEEAIVIENAVGGGGLNPAQGVQRLDHLRQHLIELAGVLERLRANCSAFDIESATQDVSLAEVKARLRGAAATQPRIGEIDLF